jgi:ribosomal protein S18 acetylase RimI-like enzyme
MAYSEPHGGAAREEKPMPLRVRRASPEDAAAVAAMSRALREIDGDPPQHLTAEALLRDGFGPEPQFALLVAELDESVVGYALFHDSYEPIYAARGVYLCDLFVKSEARRQGVGRALVAAVARDARNRGRSFVWWVSRPHNKAAHAFYAELKAFTEPVVAFAVFDEAFERLTR